MPAWEREHGELPSPTFVPVGRKAGGHACFWPPILFSPKLFSSKASLLQFFIIYFLSTEYFVPMD
jgi:hypothetical protein